MKILFIASTPESIIPFRGKLLRTLVSLGVKVSVCAPFTNQHHSIVRELSDSYMVQTYTIALGKAGINVISDFRYLIMLINVIKLIKPNAIFCYTMKPVIYGSIAGWISRVSNTYSMITGLGFLFIDTDSFFKKKIQFIGKAILSFSLTKNKKIFFQNVDDQKLFFEQKIIGKSQSTHVVNGSGVDIEFYNQRPLPSEPIFLLIARMIVNKGIYEYVEAIRQVKKKFPLVKFSIVGGLEENIDGIDEVVIQSWVSEGLFEYRGVVSDVRLEIEKCSIYVLPSYREGTPRSVLEAMSMARPIITSDVPGCRETVLNGITGILVKPRNSSDLANAMQVLIQDQNLRESMGQKSREYAVKKYSDEMVVTDIISNIGM